MSFNTLDAILIKPWIIGKWPIHVHFITNDLDHGICFESMTVMICLNMFCYAMRFGRCPEL